MSDDEDSRYHGGRKVSIGEFPARNHSPQHETLLINTLPPELLVPIIEAVRVAQKTSGTYWVASPWTLTYQLVCRRWRDVIWSTPSLWQEIIVFEGAEQLELCLRRCAGALATVHVWHPTMPERTFATLGQHASSIKAYYVHCDVPQLDYLSGLPLLLETHMPVLETLSLTGPYYEDEILDVTITRDLVPRLTTLELRNCIAPRDIAVYTPLRRLSISGSECKFTYSQFLHLIRKCLALEHLSLDSEILDPFTMEVAHLPPHTAPLVLPRLKTIGLAGDHPVLFHLLSTIHAPQAIKIGLSGCIDDDLNDEPLPLFTRLLAPDSQSRFPFLSDPRVISLRCWDNDAFDFSIRCGPDSSSILSIDLGMVFNETWPGNENLERNLVAAMDFLAAAAAASAAASVHTLKIEGYPNKVAVETWQRVFHTFTGLRTLHIRGGGTFDSLWLGLQRATQSSSERDDGAVCCPSFSEILVDEPGWRVSHYKFDATAALFDLIPRTLRARVDAGGARLKRLQLYLRYTDELWSRTSELRDAFVGDVKALVEELEYSDGRT